MRYNLEFLSFLMGVAITSLWFLNVYSIYRNYPLIAPWWFLGLITTLGICWAIYDSKTANAVHGLSVMQRIFKRQMYLSIFLMISGLILFIFTWFPIQQGDLDVLQRNNAYFIASFLRVISFIVGGAGLIYYLYLKQEK